MNYHFTYWLKSIFNLFIYIRLNPYVIPTLPQAGKLAVIVRYGSRVLELGNNKYAVEVAVETDLIKTLDVIKLAVLAGELDAQIDTATSKLRAGFARSVR